MQQGVEILRQVGPGSNSKDRAPGDPQLLVPVGDVSQCVESAAGPAKTENLCK